MTRIILAGYASEVSKQRDSVLSNIILPHEYRCDCQGNCNCQEIYRQGFESGKKSGKWSALYDVEDRLKVIIKNVDKMED